MIDVFREMKAGFFHDNIGPKTMLSIPAGWLLAESSKAVMGEAWRGSSTGDNSSTKVSARKLRSKQNLVAFAFGSSSGVILAVRNWAEVATLLEDTKSTGKGGKTHVIGSYGRRQQKPLVNGSYGQRRQSAQTIVASGKSFRKEIHWPSGR